MKLNAPIQYGNNTIIALEIIEPKKGQVCDSAWEHAEFVTTEPYKKIMDRYSNLEWDTSSMNRSIYSHLKLRLTDSMQLKFHKIDILETIKLDK